MNVSIVIPVYNEAEHLGACLDAIARQSVEPFEVIVVDNNSTDATVAVAERYEFVTVIKEARQGVVHARTTGFNRCKGDIIARIDGDSILPANWVASIKSVFKDPGLAATSGVAHYYNVAFSKIFDTIDIFFRRRLSWQLKDRMYLWGANMAVRTTAWHDVKKILCERGGQHEDYDLAIHLQERGHKVTFNESMHANVSSRRIDVGYWKFIKYVWVSPGTYAQHKIRSRWHMYPIVAVCAIGYVPARILHRGYDPYKAKFSFSQLFAVKPANVPRVDPTSNVA